MASPSAQSKAEMTQWMQRVHAAQSKRSPEALEDARRRAEHSRQMELNYRKSKAVKSHMVRSRALVSETMNQMANSTGASHSAIQERWRSAQAVSKKRQVDSYESFSNAPAPGSASRVLAAADEEEDEAMGEVAGLMGAADYGAMVAVAEEGLADAAGADPAAPPAPGAPSRGSSRSKVQELMKQLRREPTDEGELAAKFMLYDGYSEEVKEMREQLFKFVTETRPTVPDAVRSDMDRQLKKIDSAETMGIPDDVREWIVFHMMRQAEKNNLSMAGILEALEKKLEFLASSDQSECPVCLDSFATEGPHVAVTLGCCHKVCKECWDNWAAATRGRPFCPLCKHDEFLGTVAAEMRTAADSVGSDSV